jgi:hypothetical protein
MIKAFITLLKALIIDLRADYSKHDTFIVEELPKTYGTKIRRLRQ